MKYSFGSYSFHNLLAAGKQDIFQHIKDCKTLGACQLDPWSAHLADAVNPEIVAKAAQARRPQLPRASKEHLKRVKAAALEAELPWGCIACDGAHIYEADENARKRNRTAAFLWLQAAEFLGARQVRIDAGGPIEMPGHVFKIIVEGYNDIIPRARDKGVQVLIENHWGPSPLPDNLVKLLDSIDGLGLLFDTNNWAAGHQEEGWVRCARYAAATHVKTFTFDQDGWDPTVDLRKAIRTLVEAGYSDVWGVESCPKDGNEIEAARKTVDLIQRALAELQK